MMKETADQRPAYMRIAEEMEDAISTGKIVPGERLLPERELARQYQVSRMTLRQALQQLDRKGLLLRTPGRGTTVVKPRSVAKREHVVGFVTPFTVSPRDAMMYQLERVLYEQGADVMISHTLEDTEIEARRVNDLVEKGVEGLIIIPTREYRNLPLFEKLGQSIPIVLAQRQVESTLDVVATNEVQGGYLATKHLIDLGHQCIGYVHSMENPLSGYRREGYVQALREFGLPAHPSYVLSHQTGNQGLSDVYKLMVSTLNRDRTLTGFVCFNDLYASAALYAVADIGLTVPDDVAVIGYDNSEVAEVTHPQLTSVDRRAAQVGIMAAERLLKRIRANNTLKGEPLWVNPDIVVRSSCGPAKTENKQSR